ncbi:MAG: TonB-dependent receptor [Salinivirgaceae bacterium]
MKSILYLILTILTLTGAAQTTITGIVKDKQGVLLVGANIYLDGTYDGTTSNANGQFNLKTGEEGKQLLKVDNIGFENYTQELDLNGTSLNLNIELHEAFNELEAVNISAGTFEAGDKKKSIAITSLDMVTTPSATRNIYGAIQTLPGTTTNGESGKLFVKGGDENESKTFIDGTLVYVPYSSSAPNTSVRGRFNPFMFSGTMFSTGGYSAEYGQALSSILSLKTNEMPVQDQLNISLMTVGGSLAGTKTWEKSSLTTSLNYNNLKPYMSLVQQNTQWEKYPESLSGELTYRQKTARSGLFKLYANVGQSNFTLSEPNMDHLDGQNQYNLVNNNVFINASWAGELTHNWILTTGLSYTHNVDYVTMDSSDYNEFLNGTHAKITMGKLMNNTLRIKMGAEVFAKEFTMEYLSRWDSINKGFTNRTAAAFVEADIYANTKFVTRMGVRAEYSDYLNKSSVSPRFSAAYKITEKGQLSLSYGWFLQDPADDILLYTKSLNYERADHYTFNYQFEKDERVLRSELYYKQYKNLVKFAGDEFYNPEIYNNTGKGYAYGFDLFWRDNKTIKFGEYWVSYSYIDSKRDFKDYPQIAIPDYTSKHNLTLVYKHWIGLLRSQLGASYKLASPRYYNNPNSVVFNNERTIPYQTLDLNWSFLYRQNVIIYASISNVPGFKQHYGYNYTSTPNADGVYEATPILPAAKRFFLVACFITLSRQGDINQMDKIN